MREDSSEKYRLKKAEDAKVDKIIIRHLEDYLTYLHEFDVLGEQLKTAENHGKYLEFEKSITEKKSQLLNLNRKIATIYGEKTNNNMYTFNDIALKLKEISDQHKKEKVVDPSKINLSKN